MVTAASAELAERAVVGAHWIAIRPGLVASVERVEAAARGEPAVAAPRLETLAVLASGATEAREERAAPQRMAMAVRAAWAAPEVAGLKAARAAGAVAAVIVSPPTAATEVRAATAALEDQVAVSPAVRGYPIIMA